MSNLFYKHALILLIFSVFLSCFPAKKISLPKKLNPEEVLKKACFYEENLKTFASRFSVEFKEKKDSFSTNIELLHKKPDKFAIYLKSRLGINFIKLVFRNDSLIYFRPDENQIYSGSYDSLLLRENWEWEIDLKTLLYFIVGKTGLADPKTRFLKSEGRYLVYILEEDEWIKKFWIDQNKALLKKSFWIKRKDQKSFLIRYERHDRFGDFNYPERIRIKSLSGLEVDVRFKKLKFNLDLEDKRFKIELPSSLES
ncbi:MAG: hypothetical protein AMJ90_00205 [candidate division Zixibacteria bacterium SM23_73_2]|nr:MAG: hypothetical protein AMJ90_00205 [candidate division Zixibacteria bacterium SM23_73_2]